MRFSIVIPNYNSEKWINKCLDSILNQTFKDYEIIVVDDISDDNSVNIIKEKLRSQDKLIINKTKRLNGGTRNVGIAEANGEYTICIDCDDWLSDNKVLEDINNKLKNEDILFLGYKYYTYNYSCDTILQYNNLKDSFKNIICAIWTKCVKTDLLKRVPFPEGTLFEDRIQHYRLLLQAKTFNNLGRITYVWNRTNIKNISEREDYIDYRFNYCGELYRFIKELTDIEDKQYILNELTGYLDSCNKMVEELWRQ